MLFSDNGGDLLLRAPEEGWDELVKARDELAKAISVLRDISGDVESPAWNAARYADAQHHIVKADELQRTAFALLDSKPFELPTAVRPVAGFTDTLTGDAALERAHVDEAISRIERVRRRIDTMLQAAERGETRVPRSIPPDDPRRSVPPPAFVTTSGQEVAIELQPTKAIATWWAINIGLILCAVLLYLFD